MRVYWKQHHQSFYHQHDGITGIIFVMTSLFSFHKQHDSLFSPIWLSSILDGRNILPSSLIAINNNNNNNAITNPSIHFASRLLHLCFAILASKLLGRDILIFCLSTGQDIEVHIILLLGFFFLSPFVLGGKHLCSFPNSFIDQYYYHQRQEQQHQNSDGTAGTTTKPALTETVALLFLLFIKVVCIISITLFHLLL